VWPRIKTHRASAGTALRSNGPERDQIAKSVPLERVALRRVRGGPALIAAGNDSGAARPVPGDTRPSPAWLVCSAESRHSFRPDGHAQSGNESRLGYTGGCPNGSNGDD
jgi:hypothetical protein